MYICMYCGYYTKNLTEFRFITKNGGISRKMFHCPCCDQVFHRKTLFLDVTPTQWALYLYAGIRAFKDNFDESKSFYHKIKFDLLKKHLKELGIATEFWESWKSAKKNLSILNIKDALNFVMMIEDKFYNEKKFKQIKLGDVNEISK